MNFWLKPTSHSELRTSFLLVSPKNPQSDLFLPLNPISLDLDSTLNQTKTTGQIIVSLQYLSDSLNTNNYYSSSNFVAQNYPFWHSWLPTDRSRHESFLEEYPKKQIADNGDRCNLQKQRMNNKITWKITGKSDKNASVTNIPNLPWQQCQKFDGDASVLTNRLIKCVWVQSVGPQGKKLNTSSNSRSKKRLNNGVMCVRKSKQKQENAGIRMREIKKENNILAKHPSTDIRCRTMFI